MAVGLSDLTKEKEDNELVYTFEKQITKIGNRYQVSWPWKLSKYELASNYNLCENRLKSLVNQLSKDKDLFQKYDNIIKTQIKDRVVEVADSRREYKERDNVATHYLPHHFVRGKNNSKKIRIVYEGCAKSHPKQKSLNECLHRGKNIIGNLCGVLLRFRMKVLGIIADIEKAYLQLELSPDDRDVTRFLWVKDINLPFKKENILELRFCRVIWGIVCSAFLLASTIMYHLSRYDNSVSLDISRNIYVDNLISGISSTEEGITYYKETKKIFDDASMNMRQW